MSHIFHVTLAAALTLGAAALRAQSGEEFPLLTLPPAAPAAETVEARKVGLDDKGLNRAVGGITIPTLTVYRATSPTARRAAVVICPGGAYGRLALQIITDGGHGFGLGRSEASRRWPAEFVAWLAQLP